VFVNRAQGHTESWPEIDGEAAEAVKLQDRVFEDKACDRGKVGRWRGPSQSTEQAVLGPHRAAAPIIRCQGFVRILTRACGAAAVCDLRLGEHRGLCRKERQTRGDGDAGMVLVWSRRGDRRDRQRYIERLHVRGGRRQVLFLAETISLLDPQTSRYRTMPRSQSRRRAGLVGGGFGVVGRLPTLGVMDAAAARFHIEDRRRTRVRGFLIDASGVRWGQSSVSRCNINLRWRGTEDGARGSTVVPVLSPTANGYGTGDCEARWVTIGALARERRHATAREGSPATGYPQAR